MPNSPAETASEAAHRQTRYESAPAFDGPQTLPMPALTPDLEQARADLREYGMCLLSDGIPTDVLAGLREKLDAQAEAERGLGEQSPLSARGAKQHMSNMVNKGKAFLDLVERPETDALAGYLLGKNFLISSITGGLFHGPTDDVQPLHRDQGQVPATVDFPATCNVFWLLDDFAPEGGSTHVVPGSHRWPAAHQIRPPERDQSVQITAPAGTIFAWDGRLWHGAGANPGGASRRHINTYYCLPWMRQQENWGVTCLQEVLDEATPKLQARLGLRTYGTLGMMSGTPTREGGGATFGNADVVIPDHIIGEGGTLHPVRRVRRSDIEAPIGD
jgi:ectoine hydroxylase-related dioxygenase (phytanoyl-CoA dioxygenase family)